MTFKIKLLSAAALCALPAVAGAQATAQQQPAPRPSTSMENVTQAVQNAQDSQQQPQQRATPPAGEQVPDEQPRQADQTPPQPAQQPPAESQDDAPPAPSATQQQPPAGTQAQQAQPPAETQQQPPAQAQQQPAPADAQAQAQPAATAQAGATRVATAADVTAGAQIRDTAGAPVGTVESVDADSAVVSTGSVRADIPITSFGHNGQGLVLAMTRAQLEAAARAATRTPTG